MKNVEIKKVTTTREMKSVFDIRQEVFVQGQNVPSELELDGLDDDAEHVILNFNDMSVGCARYRFVENNVKLERLAVRSSYRGMGFGGMIMRYMLEDIGVDVLGEIYLNAQNGTQDFYRKFGFEEVGTMFMEAGIRHQKMILKPQVQKTQNIIPDQDIREGDNT